ncbi:MAG: hypothetical protein Q4D76_20255, partial [Oscillospiraceae bacterium]|nr:hypothetical protein [Oscillospiraceae bacterium]
FEFAKTMLQEIHVAASPGIDFGKNQTQKYIRFSYTRGIEHMKEGVDRMRNWLKDNKHIKKS